MGCSSANIAAVARFFHQLEALQNAETVLLVNDDQAWFRELNFLFQQSMGADDKLRAPLRDVAADFALAVRLQRAGQQDDAIAGILQDSARGKIMLLRENFGGRH